MTKRSPLHDTHAYLGARFVGFGGWEMPVHYGSVLAEHGVVRAGVGVFDVTHLGRLSVRGPGAGAALGILSNDASSYEPGRTHYTMLLDEDGGIVDDIVVWRWGVDEYWVMPNAANSRTVMTAIESAGSEVVVEDLRPDTVFLAVQGPEAPSLLEQVLGEAPRRFRTLSIGDVRLAGTGYTGESGGELCMPVLGSSEIFESLITAGAVPCGLGSRDTLRLEAGLVLWGADIDRTTTPLEAGLDFAVRWDHDFVGRSALQSQSEAGIERRLAGLVMEGRGIPRHGYPARSGSSTGEVTSGNMSPVLQTGIALAYLSPPVAAGDAAEVQIRGSWVPARVQDPPFHR